MSNELEQIKSQAPEGYNLYCIHNRFMDHDVVKYYKKIGDILFMYVAPGVHIVVDSRTTIGLKRL